VCQGKSFVGVVTGIAVVVLVSLLSVDAARADTIIDTFETEQLLTQVGVGSTSGSVDVSAGMILGGERDVRVGVTTGDGTLNIDANLSLPGGFSHAQAGLVQGATLITYDGNDDDPEALDPEGLGGLDLTQGGGATALYVNVPFVDNGADLAVTVYTNATMCSTLSEPLPPGIFLATQPKAIIFPFASFVRGSACASPADFSNVGAIMLLIEGTAVGAVDVSLNVFAAGATDLGDLPVAFENTTLAPPDEGAAHVICPTLKLGAVIDAEADGQESADATGDDAAGPVDDEDGVVLTPGFDWVVGTPTDAGGKLDVTVSGEGCLSGWIDWNGDNDFDDNGENVIDNAVLSTGTHTLEFEIVNGPTFPNPYFARFRLFDRDDPTGANNCSSDKDPRFQNICGEVEDYLLQVNVPTPTPTLTPTLTPTPTPTLTPSLTPTPTICPNGVQDPDEECDDGNLNNGDGCDNNCTTTGCGNGIVTEGEECDDGNTVKLDGCEPDCTLSPCTKDGDRLVPGYCATKKNDCIHEFCPGAVPKPTDRHNGLPGALIECTEGDPACDLGPVGDNVCTMSLSLCFNVVEDRFPFVCQSSGEVKYVRLRKARKNPVDIANRDALEAAVAGLGAELVLGPGIPSRRAMLFDPPLTEPDVCTDFAEINVPLRKRRAGGFAKGRKVILVIADPPKKGPKRPKFDTDYLKLICNPG
jgi:cysteine-rich repeat protein